jgi:hypothetical protein
MDSFSVGMTLSAYLFNQAKKKKVFLLFDIKLLFMYVINFYL